MADLEQKFAENLKYFRKQLNLTQKELAGQLNCSEKAVSKWECGASIPDIGLLLALSRALHTDVETLFADRETMYLLGIDGGGTKTKLKLCDLSGACIKELCTDGCNPMDIGAARAQEVLRSAIYEICADVSLSRVTVFAGLSGGISGNMKAIFASFFETFRFYASENDSDNKNIIAAGLGDEDGITLILGTGICSFRQQDKQHFMVGGKGYLIDAGGSAYHLGRDALHAYFCEKDGMGPKTQLTEEIDKLGNKSVPTLMQEIYAEGKKYIASYAKTVYAAIAKGMLLRMQFLEKIWGTQHF